MIQKIQATPVFKKLLKAENDGYAVIKLQGGSRSSKTWSIFQFFLKKAVQGERFDVTITRAYLQLAKDTLLNDFQEILEKYRIPVYPDINPNRPSQVYHVYGGKFVFWGLDKPKKAHGKKQKYTWMNETIEVEHRGVFDQLEMRTDSIMILDYNPSDDAHWVFELDKRPDVYTFTSTQLDNPFLPDKIRRKIQGYEPTEENIKNGTADNYMWEVYGLGKPARLQGVIFENWDIVEEIPADSKHLGLGLDFGYTNDPTTLTDIYMYNNEIYLDELIYERGLKNHSPYPEERTIVKRLQELGIGSKEITADSAEPKSIDEIASHGFNINGADKGPDSIKYGIDLMKGYKLHVTKRSINIQTELRKYKWAEDRNGKSLNVPIDDFNHSIDGIRYRLAKVLGNQFEVEIYPSGILG